MVFPSDKNVPQGQYIGRRIMGIFCKSPVRDVICLMSLQITPATGFAFRMYQLFKTKNVDFYSEQYLISYLTALRQAYAFHSTDIWSLRDRINAACCILLILGEQVAIL